MIQGGFVVPSYRMTQPAALCRYCVPGMEFRSMKTQECEACTPARFLQCDTGVKYVACTAERDAHCPTAASQVAGSFCNNDFVDFGEQCDASAKYSKTAACCTDSTCVMLEGYYTDPPCSTICGDGIVAGLEECDSLTDSRCDMVFCTNKSSSG